MHGLCLVWRPSTHNTFTQLTRVFLFRLVKDSSRSMAGIVSLTPPSQRWGLPDWWVEYECKELAATTAESTLALANIRHHWYIPPPIHTTTTVVWPLLRYSAGYWLSVQRPEAYCRVHDLQLLHAGLCCLLSAPPPQHFHMHVLAYVFCFLSLYDTPHTGHRPSRQLGRKAAIHDRRWHPMPHRKAIQKNRLGEIYTQHIFSRICSPIWFSWMALGVPRAQRCRRCSRRSALAGDSHTNINIKSYRDVMHDTYMKAAMIWCVFLFPHIKPSASPLGTARCLVWKWSYHGAVLVMYHTIITVFSIIITFACRSDHFLLFFSSHNICLVLVVM